MDEFVARLNLGHLQRKLPEEIDASKREKLARLLREEEAKLAAIEASKNLDKKT